MDLVSLRTHFIEEACDLGSIQENIVRPFNRWLKAGTVFNGTTDCHS